jgi:tetratricopeptide (TPR) repeat protein
MTSVPQNRLALLVFLSTLLFSSPPVSAQAPANPIADSLIAGQIRLGLVAMQRGDYRQACEMFRLVLDVDWNNPQAYRWWAKAEADLAGHIQGLVQAGDRSMGRGEYAEALANYHEALRADSTRADIRQRVRWAGRKIYADRLVLAGLTAYLAGDYNRMNSALDSALAYNPEHAAALALREKCRPGATTAERSQLRDDPAMWELHLSALKMYRDGDYAAAIEQWETILQKYPGDADVLANIEQARLRLQPGSGDVK